MDRGGAWAGDLRCPAGSRGALGWRGGLSLSAPAGQFVYQRKSECHFTNGTKWFWYLDRYIWNQQPYLHFDSDLGRFVADTELGRPIAEYWNSRPEILAAERAEVDTFCRHNYGVEAPFTVGRRGECRGWGWCLHSVSPPPVIYMVPLCAGGGD
uniref:MHC class II beta chain N-terminal domain-containing protein n=1 Tax=Chrysemys picta bellii TaxID=8478 RepID=A0A8C3F419_CHRPI